MKLIKFTAPDGSDIWTSPDMICTVSKSSKSESPNANCLIRTAGGPEYVKETVDQVVYMVNNGDHTA